MWTDQEVTAKQMMDYLLETGSTLRDIAEASGLSISTLRRAHNGDSVNAVSWACIKIAFDEAWNDEGDRPEAEANFYLAEAGSYRF